MIVKTTPSIIVYEPAKNEEAIFGILLSPGLISVSMNLPVDSSRVCPVAISLTIFFFLICRTSSLTSLKVLFSSLLNLYLMNIHEVCIISKEVENPYKNAAAPYINKNRMDVLNEPLLNPNPNRTPVNIAENQRMEANNHEDRGIFIMLSKKTDVLETSKE